MQEMQEYINENQRDYIQHMQEKGEDREDNHHKISKLECSNIEFAIMDCYSIEHDKKKERKGRHICSEK